MLYKLTLCKACLQRLVTRNKFVRLKSHYAVLGVSNTATQKEIRDAYIKLSKKLHPDQNRHDTQSHEKFVKINEAYEVLSKDSSRRNYDDTLRMRNQPRPDFGTYRTTHRPPNYYSGGQFYEDQGNFGPYNYNPYSKRNEYSNYDPFSSNGYEYYQRQRQQEPHKEENKTHHDQTEENENDDDRVLVAFHRISRTMAFLMAMFMLWEVIIHAHIKVTTHGLRQEVERRNRSKEHKLAENSNINSKAKAGRESS